MRKISLVLIICLIFMSFGNNISADEIFYTDTLRVGLSYGSSAQSTAWFYSDAPIDIIDAAYSSYIMTIPAKTKFSINAVQGMLTSDYFAPTTSPLRLESTELMQFNNSEYRGSFEVSCDTDKVTVINIVNTEEYLASVLGCEMSVSWPMEALKAQAVCARNFAIKNLGKHSSYGFDICTTQDCQVYRGTSSEGTKTIKAVQETAGVLVTYKGKVVPLFYFSCDGGYTENSENVWVSAEGYLRGKKDIYEKEEYATYYNWSVTYTKGEIENILNTRRMGVGELLDIRIDEMSENNGVIKLTFVGTEGEKTVTKTSTRTVLSLKSQAYTIEKHASEATVETQLETVTYHVLTAEGVKQVTNPAYALTGTGLEAIPYETVEVERPAQGYASYTFNGHGWGHLVGMSQWGAYSMAVEGYTYKDILSFYFTDIEIKENSFVVPEVGGEDVLYPEEETVLPDETTEEIEDDTIYDDTQWSDTGL
ncbi:MAG: SpoIID/LytB domain-containing protein [Clostridia bacterium]|nr:SpoIID/LytB domain-containing protein [Clostridia bacterium]